MHWMAKQRCRDRQGEAKRWTARLLESHESWMQFRLKPGISRDACCQKISSYLKLHQVTSSWSLEVEAAHHQRRGVKFWHWWMDEVRNERNASFYSICSKASWAKCEQSEKLARKEILQKLNVTMQKRVSKAESSKAKIYNARCKNSKTWIMEVGICINSTNSTDTDTVCHMCCRVAALLHQLSSGVRLARRVPVWMMPRAKLPRQHVPWQKRCEKMFGILVGCRLTWRLVGRVLVLQDIWSKKQSKMLRENSVYKAMPLCRYTSLPGIPCTVLVISICLLKSLQSPESLACSDVSTDAEKLKAEARVQSC